MKHPKIVNETSKDSRNFNILETEIGMQNSQIQLQRTMTGLVRKQIH